MENRKRPLEGIRVADFSWQAAGPITSKVLADNGAEVILVESQARLTTLRGTQPMPEGKSGLNVNAYFNDINTSKMAITLNLNYPKAQELAKRLVAVSDVVVNNYRPGVMARWGLDYPNLVKIKPDIIMICLSAMGQKGPYSHWAGHSMSLQAAAGLNVLTGFPDHPPEAYAMAYPDATSNPFHGVISVLAALRYRRRTGKGQFIDFSQYESTIALISGTAILDYTANGRVQGCMGNRSPYAAPHGAYRCQGEDRWCAIAVFKDEEWKAFCDVLGNPLWSRDGKFSTLLDRKKNEDKLDRLVEEWTTQRTAEEVMTLMQARGVAAGVVETAEDAMEWDPQLKARNYWQPLEHPEAGVQRHHTLGYKLSVTPHEMRRAPLLGEHNDYVYREILGLSQEEVDELLVEGVID